MLTREQLFARLTQGTLCFISQLDSLTKKVESLTKNVSSLEHDLKQARTNLDHKRRQLDSMRKGQGSREQRTPRTGKRPATSEPGEI